MYSCAVDAPCSLTSALSECLPWFMYNGAVRWKSLCLTLFLFWFRCSFLQVKVLKLLEHFLNKDVS